LDLSHKISKNVTYTDTKINTVAISPYVTHQTENLYAQK